MIDDSGVPCLGCDFLLVFGDFWNFFTVEFQEFFRGCSLWVVCSLLLWFSLYTLGSIVNGYMGFFLWSLNFQVRVLIVRGYLSGGWFPPMAAEIVRSATWSPGLCVYCSGRSLRFKHLRFCAVYARTFSWCGLVMRVTLKRFFCWGHPVRSKHTIFFVAGSRGAWAWFGKRKIGDRKLYCGLVNLCQGGDC